MEGLKHRSKKGHGDIKIILKKYLNVVFQNIVNLIYRDTQMLVILVVTIYVGWDMLVLFVKVVITMGSSGANSISIL